MKNKKCPYCSRRISYISAFSSRRKAEYICDRCGKESKVVINRKVILAFAACALISIAIMIIWIVAGLAHNPLGILLVAVPLIVFTVISPSFVNYAPLKKYKKSMEARKAGIEYSDNLVTSELDEADSSFGGFSDTGSGFKINSDVFNTIRAERNAAREKLQNSEDISSSSELNTPANTEKTAQFVPVIKNVSKNGSSADAPLRKLHSEGAHQVSRTRHYIPEAEESEAKRSEGNRYSANRKF